MKSLILGTIISLICCPVLFAAGWDKDSSTVHKASVQNKSFNVACSCTRSTDTDTTS